MRDGAERGLGDPAQWEKSRDTTVRALSKKQMDVWVTRQTTIAVTTIMLIAESYGFDTAPMEGFDGPGIKREFALPDEAEVVATLAIGRGKQPEKPYPGRLPMERTVFLETYGTGFPE